MKKIKLILMLVVLSGILMAVGCSKEKDTPAPVTPPTQPPPTSTCPTGYTGTNCETQITPSSIKITKITVTKFPQYDGGSDWDVLDIGDYRPELLIRLSFGGSILFTTGYFTDANYYQTYEWNASNTGSIFPYTIIATSSLFTIEAYDYDTGTSDFMGTLYFPSYSSSTNGFPSVITTTSSNLEFKIYVTYVF